MLKSLIQFFRKRNIKKNIRQDRTVSLPNLDKPLSMTILIDGSKKVVFKNIEQFIKSSFKPKSLNFVIVCETLPDDIIQMNFMMFVKSDDFNKVGIMKKEQELLLKSMNSDLLINLSDNNKDLLNDYLVSSVNSSFKIGHHNANMKLHDLVIDFGIEKSDVERLKILYKYMLMLSGNKNEE